MASTSEEPTISIPSLVIVLGILFVTYRWFFASRSDSSSSSGSRSRSRFTAAHVEQISAMFPQLSRRDIMWDLHRNGGSVQATTERILGGRALDPAPPTFVPPISLTTTSSTTAGAQQPVKVEPDLITRYNLQSKVSSSTKGKEREEEEVRTGWAGNKEDRQKMLQRRRDEMILKARRKMQEKEAETPS